MRYFVAASAIFIFCVPANSQIVEPLDPDARRLVTEIATASTPVQAARGYARLVSRANQRLLRRLKRVPEHGVAIYAGWCAMGKSRAAVARFCGFVAGRLGIELPSWWEESVNWYLFAEESDSFPNAGGCHWVQFAGGEIAIPAHMTMREERGGISLHTGRSSMFFNPMLSKKYHLKSTGRIIASFEGDRCFLALPGWGSYPLICIDRKTGKQLWESKVWAHSTTAAITGGWPTNTAIIEQENRVLVLGSSLGNIYIEAFDRTTGRSEFRFASRYEDDK